MEWIKCSDRLPNAPRENDLQSVSVLISDGEKVGIGWYEAEYNIKDDPNAFEGQTEIFSSATWHLDGGCLVCDHCGFPEVTHWMPLPGAPNG